MAISTVVAIVLGILLVFSLAGNYIQYNLRLDLKSQLYEAKKVIAPIHRAVNSVVVDASRIAASRIVTKQIPESGEDHFSGIEDILDQFKKQTATPGTEDKTSEILLADDPDWEDK